MTTRIVLVLSGVLAAVSPAARAEPSSEACCYDDTPCSTYTVEESDVVGVRQCPRYGMWGHDLHDPYVFVDAGMNMRHITQGSSHTSLARTVGGAGKTGTLTSNSDRALTFDERIGYDIVHGLYAAFDFELGNFDSGADAENSFVFDTLGSIGIRGELGPIALAGELSGGVMQSWFPPQQDSRIDGIVETRGRAELWLGPWITLGGLVGISVLDRSEWVAGLYIGFHSWGYAGDRWR